MSPLPVAFLALVLASCNEAEPGDAAAAGDPPPAPVAIAPDSPATAETPPTAGHAPPDQDEPWLTRQPRLAELRTATPPEMGWSPGTTPWSPSRQSVPERLTEAHVRAHGGPSSPGDAMAALATELGLLAEVHGEGRQEVTLRAIASGADRATGVVAYWGALDDAVAGSDLRADLRSIDGSWYVERLDQRFHCRRGVTDGLCV